MPIINPEFQSANNKIIPNALYIIYKLIFQILKLKLRAFVREITFFCRGIPTIKREKNEIKIIFSNMVSLLSDSKKSKVIFYRIFRTNLSQSFSKRFDRLSVILFTVKYFKLTRYPAYVNIKRYIQF
jgi:hypothetical protein